MEFEGVSSTWRFQQRFRGSKGLSGGFKGISEDLRGFQGISEALEESQGRSRRVSRGSMELEMVFSLG